MAKLTINGQKVTVDDSFLSMTPEQQNATVDEISASLGGAASQPTPQASPAATGPVSAPAGLRPGSREYADWAATNARAGNQLPQVSANPNSPQMNYDTALARVRSSQFPDMTDEQFSAYSKEALAPYSVSSQAGQGGALGFGDEVAGLVGGLGAATREAVGGGGSGFGPAFNDWQGLDEARYRLGQEQNGVAGGVAETVGSLTSFGPGKKLMQEALTRGTSLASQIPRTFGQRSIDLGKTALSSSAAGGISGYAQGFGNANGGLAERNEQGVASGKAGATIGALVPVGTAAIGAAGRGVYNASRPVVGAILDPVGEAFRKVGTVVGRDRRAGTAMSQADELIARDAGIPLTNVDRGGETTRALARSVANQNPEARDTLTGLSQERYKGQSGRAVDFVKRLFGRVDDLDYRDQLNTANALTNAKNYDAAFNSSQGRAVWTKEISQLMQSPSFRSAISSAESRGADKAAVAGFKAVKNPFVFGPDGNVTLKPAGPNGRALPSIAFWDQVKRNLDSQIGTAQRAGDNALSRDLVQLKTKLVSSLDAAVPDYAAARLGASAAFGADNAIDAGRQFARAPGQVPEAERAFNAMSKAEKEAFSVGYASEVVDRINARGDSQNIIKQMFESPAARQLNETILGKAKAQQLEAYVRVEALADKLRGALGNSTTARQLVELGLGGVGGFSLTGDWKGAIGGAILAKGGRYAGEKIDARVMENVAKLLVSGSRADLDKAVVNASLSPEWMKALQLISDQVGSTGGVVATSATQ